MRKKLIYIFLIFTIVLTSIYIEPSLGEDIEAEADIEISTVDEFIEFVIESQEESFKNKTIVLIEDISLEGLTMEYLKENFPKFVELEMTHLTIGNNKQQFSGVFDGQNHTISGLNYVKFFFPSPNSGLFAWTEGAEIKNLKILNAQICCIYQGGIVVGYANDTKIENVSVVDSDLNVKTANNIISLITNGGFCGGAIAGYSVNSKLYNCEIAGTRVHNTVVEGVAGVGGEAMYMGGLVGLADNTDVIYCRARTTYLGEGIPLEYEDDDGRYTTEDGRRMSYVSNVHNVAVGALGGKQLFAGGIAGGARDSNFYDCYCTAEVSFYAATYVSVGAGIVGFGGGILGKLINGRIERCSFAGNIYSTQYNAVLVIPIIQKDVHISGIVEYIKGNNVINNSYFRPSDIESGSELYAVANKYDTEESKSLSDDLYRDVNFWESKDYNFIEGNKWVMDYELGIPVHGHSVGLTFDFPNSAIVWAKPTILTNEEVQTDSCYDFAVQGLHPKNDQEITVGIDLNEGYEFRGWYKKENVKTRNVENSEPVRDITSLEELKIEEMPIKVKDNDLVVGAVEGLVSYHDIDGKEIKRQWHRYKTPLEEEKPEKIEGDGSFCGWTTVSNDGRGYDTITSSELEKLKANGNFYIDGDLVRKTMHLYPIYIDATANILVEIEGHDEDTDAIRTGLGEARVKKEDDELYIDVDYEGGEIPQGYRFKGWYKDIDGGEICVSREERFRIEDISKKVKYIARYEYEVSYMVKTYYQDGLDTESYKYKGVWHDYEDVLVKLEEPSYLDETIIHWGTKHKEHEIVEECEDDLTGEIIKNPKKVYSHNYSEYKKNILSVYADSDFPDSGEITTSKTGGRKFEYTPFNQYQFRFWTLERENLGRAWTYAKNVMDVENVNSLRIYKARAMVTTNIRFHKKDGIKEVLRRYKDPILLKEDKIYEYTYPHYYKNKKVNKKTYDGYKIETSVISPASPTKEEMKWEGHAFLGWISGKEVEKDSFIWDYLYNDKEEYCTKNIERVRPYLIREKDEVESTMEVYPIYANYDIETTTNIEKLKLENINKPQIPKFELKDIKHGYSKIQVSVENNITDILKTNKSDNRKYQLVKLLCEVDGQTKILDIKKGHNKYEYMGEVQAGKKYKFIAVYSPIFVVFNKSEKTQKVVVRNYKERLGIDVEPEYRELKGIENACFIGWTKKPPANGKVHRYSSIAEYEKNQLSQKIINRDELIKENLELYPIFVKANIKLEANIEMENQEKYLWIEAREKGCLTIVAKEYPGYKFMRWEGISDKKECKVEDVFEDKIYTAIYEKACTVTYHDLKGKEVYSVSVVKGSRSFIDENGYFIDQDAILNMKLDKGQEFSEWLWKKDEIIIPWDDFKYKKIEEDINIYPRVYEITTEEDCVDFNLSKDGIGGLFVKEYLKPKINVYAYEYRGDFKKIPVKGIQSILYVETDQGIVEASLKPVDIDVEGRAEHILCGRLKVSVKMPVDKTVNKVEDVYFVKVDGKVVAVEEEVVLKKIVGVCTVVDDQFWNWRNKDERKEEKVDVIMGRTVEVALDKKRLNRRWFTGYAKK